MAFLSGLKPDNYWPELWLICPFAGLGRFLTNPQIERLPKISESFEELHLRLLLLVSYEIRC